MTQLIVAINKLEKSDWSAERYDEICALLKPYLLSVGFKAHDLFWVPISGFTGENLIEPPTDKRLTAWYKGPTLLQALDGLKLPVRNFVKPTRVTVMEYTPKSTGPLIGDCIQAKVEAGAIQDKDELVLMPQGAVIQVRGIEALGVKVPNAIAGTICEVGLKLPNDFDVNYLRKGNVLCDPRYEIPVVQKFIAKVVVYDNVIITKGEFVMCHFYTSKCTGTIQKLIATCDPVTGATAKAHPKMLKPKDFAIIQVKLEDRHCLELFSNFKNMGRVICRHEGRTVCAGTVTEMIS